MIEGAAGIGKSRLLEWARVRAAELGLRVLNARGAELEQGFPFGVARQLFERAIAVGKVITSAPVSDLHRVSARVRTTPEPSCTSGAGGTGNRSF
jgi:hypothetical protein